MKTIYYLGMLVAVIMAAGCQSAEKLMDEGRYDELVTLATKKLKGKGPAKQKDVVMAEEAFRKATDGDMSRIDRLMQSNR